MDLGTPGRFWARLKAELRRAFAEKHTPHQVAGSFAFGLFVTTLPSAGVGLLVFALLFRLTDRISKVAILASALLLNPLVKAPMYVAAFWLGNRALGGGAIGGDGGIAASATEVAARMVVGFVILGVVLAVVGYVVVYVLTVQYRARDLRIVEELVDDEFVESEPEVDPLLSGK